MLQTGSRARHKGRVEQGTFADERAQASLGRRSYLTSRNSRESHMVAACVWGGGLGGGLRLALHEVGVEELQLKSASTWKTVNCGDHFL